MNVALWPAVDPKVLSTEDRRRYRQRVSAIELYARGIAVADVERRSGLDRRTLYRALERALSAHPDGRLWGFRALIPMAHTKAYERRKRSHGVGRGLSGAFSQLLAQHSELERLVRQLIQRREVRLQQLGTRFLLQGLDPAHRQFTKACRDIGLKASDYPLNQEEQGRRSLARALRERMLEGFGEAVRAAGIGRVKPASALAFSPEAPVTDPFDTVEFDAHRLDLRLTIVDREPNGDEQLLEIERVWLLALIDVATRAILGYTLCLRREYSRYDVVRTFDRALAPMAPPLIAIPGLAPMESGGFVSHTLPETAFACWRELRVDNARAHLAADSLDVACEILGCSVDIGPVYEPDDRPFIERFFGTVASQLSDRLPGATGSRPGDPLRALRKPDEDLRLVVGLDELQELLAVWVWNYNGTPHGGLGGRTPLEAMTSALRDRGAMLRHLPESLRANLCLLQNAHRARVRGNVERGEKPRISFYHVRYTSHVLSQAPQLIGKTLRVYFDAEDIRNLRAFLADGTELGELRAGGMWQLTPHSLEMRQRIFKAKRLRELRFRDQDDPVQVFLEYKRSKARRSRRAATELAEIRERLGRPARVGGPSKPSDPEDQTRASLPLATGPVKPARLRIRPGFA